MQTLLGFHEMPTRPQLAASTLHTAPRHTHTSYQMIGQPVLTDRYEDITIRANWIRKLRPAPSFKGQRQTQMAEAGLDQLTAATNNAVAERLKAFEISRPVRVNLEV